MVPQRLFFSGKPRLGAIPRLNLALLIDIARNAFEVSGAAPSLKTQLLAEFDAWLATAMENA